MNVETLKSLVSYNPENGEFERLVKRSHNAGCGSVNTHGYVVISLLNKPYYAHRLAWLYCHGEMPKGQIDHINGDRSDNRLENLRDASVEINQQNLRKAQKNSKTGLLGVMYMGKNRRGKSYASRVHHNGKRHDLGYFETPEEAHEAYLIAKRRLHEGSTI